MMNLEQLKSRGQFFKAGHIVPTRIFRLSKRRYQHKVTFQSDTWAVPTPCGYMVICQQRRPGDMGVYVGGWLGTVRLNGAPYHPGGGVLVVTGTADQLQANEAKIVEDWSLMQKPGGFKGISVRWDTLSV